MKLLYVLAVMLGSGISALGQAAVQDAPSAKMGKAPTDVPHVYRVGGGVTAPVPLSMADPEFSKEERKKKIRGVVLLGLIVDTEGKPQQVRIKRSLADQMEKKDLKLALGMDAKAIEAVNQYRFKPAMRDGVPVPVEMNVEVNFQIF